MALAEDGMKTVILDELKEAQKTLSKPDVSMQDIAYALSLLIRISLPSIRATYVTEEAQEVRLKAFRNDCPVYTQYIADREALDRMPLYQVFKIVRRHLGWIFGGIVVALYALQKLGLFGER